MIFKINVNQDTVSMNVIEYHKGRMEPYPKVIRVYEKQKVEVFDSKFFLSIYPTAYSLCVYHLDTKDLHYTS